MYFKMLRIHNARYEHLKDTFTIIMLEPYKYIQNEAVKSIKKTDCRGKAATIVE